VAEKVNSQFLLLYCDICGEGLVENVIWGKGWLKTSEYHHTRGGGLKLLNWTFYYSFDSIRVLPSKPQSNRLNFFGKNYST